MKVDHPNYRCNFFSGEKKAVKKFRLSFRKCKSFVYNCNDYLFLIIQVFLYHISPPITFYFYKYIYIHYLKYCNRLFYSHF